MPNNDKSGGFCPVDPNAKPVTVEDIRNTLGIGKSCPVDPDQKPLTAKDMRDFFGIPEKQNVIVAHFNDMAQGILKIIDPIPKQEMAKAPVVAGPGNG